jgi:hypothetical protein
LRKTLFWSYPSGLTGSEFVAIAFCSPGTIPALATPDLIALHIEKERLRGGALDLCFRADEASGIREGLLADDLSEQSCRTSELWRLDNQYLRIRASAREQVAAGQQ